METVTIILFTFFITSAAFMLGFYMCMKTQQDTLNKMIDFKWKNLQIEQNKLKEYEFDDE